MDSILTSIKKLLGPEEDYTHYDADIIMHINTALMTLNDLGVGPPEGFVVTDSSATWQEFFQNETDEKRMQGAKTYVYLDVKLVFDPPASASVIASMEKKKAELEWRLNHAVETT